MQIILKPEQEKFIHEKLQGGRYPNVDALMLLAFHLLEEHERKEQELIELRKKIDDGSEQIKQGKTIDGELVFQQLQSNVDRQAFMRLPIEERHFILAQQAEAMVNHYEQDLTWRDWISFDVENNES